MTWLHKLVVEQLVTARRGRGRCCSDTERPDHGVLDQAARCGPHFAQRVAPPPRQWTRWNERHLTTCCPGGRVPGGRRHRRPPSRASPTVPGAARACDRQHHPRHLRAPVPVRDGHPRGPPGAGPGRGRGGAGTDPARTSGDRLGGLQVDDPIWWRRLRGSNPRGSCPPTRFPGVCLRPLGQASAGQSSQPRTTRPPGAPRGRRAMRKLAKIKRAQVDFVRLGRYPSGVPPRGCPPSSSAATAQRAAGTAEGRSRPAAGVTAARMGFEPMDALRRQRFSRPPHSSALAPCRQGV
jgi:hypothetical protein